MARPSRRRLLLAASAALFLAGAALFLLDLRLAPAARARLTQLLAARFDASVSLASLRVSLLPFPNVSGESLTLRRNSASPSTPPLISIRRFSARTTFSSLFGPVRRVNFVRLEGLEIHIPPRRPPSPPAASSAESAPPAEPPRFLPFEIDTIVADGALLLIAPNSPGKEPLEFDIPRLTLTSAGPRRPMNFRASVDNPKPPGLVQATGSFGPWLSSEPRHTALSGAYTFDHADLSVFPGISGFLSSTGRFSGVLSRIEVQGQTSTPDFTLTGAGYPVDLQTTFSAIVDGSNGNTLLQPVRASFLHSAFECTGSAAAAPGARAKTVSLDVRSLHARIQDLLRLTVHSSPPLLSGAASFHARLLIPPGRSPVLNRITLNGAFDVTHAVFSNSAAQQKLDNLSLRAQGRPKEIGESDDTAASNFSGSFVLQNAVMNFSRLAFSIPGANVNLDGSYGLVSGALDFHGQVLMQARLSQTTTGFKSLLLKAADPFFRARNAGSRIPVKITGTKDHPSIGLNLHH